MYRIIIVAKVAGCIAMCQKTRNVEQAQSTYTTNKEVSQFLSQTSQQLSSKDRLVGWGLTALLTQKQQRQLMF